VLALLASALPLHAQGATVGPNCTVTWTANTEVDLASYRVYWTLTPAAGTPVSGSLDILKPAVAAPTMTTTCAALKVPALGGALSFQIDAVDTLGNRGIKSVVSANTQDISPPGQPSGIVVTPNP
jgi:hypothetical protein